MNRKQRRARRHATATSHELAKMWELCPYRTVIGDAAGLGPNPRPEQLTKHTMAAIAVLGEPMPLSAEEMTNALAVLNAGGAVLLMSDNKAHRDHAKREIAAMLDMVPGGRA